DGGPWRDEARRGRSARASRRAGSATTCAGPRSDRGRGRRDGVPCCKRVRGCGRSTGGRAESPLRRLWGALRSSIRFFLKPAASIARLRVSWFFFEARVPPSKLWWAAFEKVSNGVGISSSLPSLSESPRSTAVPRLWFEPMARALQEEALRGGDGHVGRGAA